LKESMKTNMGKVINALLNAGYTFESSISDIVDNSLDAEATDVQVIIERDDRKSENAIERILIVDNGKGMPEAVLENALTLGSVNDGRKSNHHGIYGVGLKLATLAHCNRVIICTKEKSASALVMGFEYDANLAEAPLNLLRLNLESYLEHPEINAITKNHGTAVIMEKFRASILQDENYGQIDDLVQGVRRHLSLHFHRFLDEKSEKFLNISVTQIVAGSDKTQRTQIGIFPIDPFNYKLSATEGYPKEVIVKLNPYKPELKLKLHIWPPDYRDEAFEIPGVGSVRAQGLYIYRNNRLICRKDWPGNQNVRKELSLARIEIDLPIELEEEFNLVFSKSQINIPYSLAEIFNQNKDIQKFYQDAASSWNSKPASMEAPALGEGIDRDIAKKYGKIFFDNEEEATKLLFIDFHWERMDEDVVFELRSEQSKRYPDIYLNSIYREDINHDRSNSKNDAPVFKILLFEVLKPHLQQQRMGARRKEFLRDLNVILIHIFIKNRKKYS
jgi:hypothetical protein